jgi:hypothetical protein
VERVDLDTFLASPIGHFHASGPLLLWAWSPKVVGLSHFGRVTTADIPLLKAGAIMPFHPSLARPYTAVVDSSRLVHLDPAVFAMLTEHLQAVREAGSAMIEHLRIVRPPGPRGGRGDRARARVHEPGHRDALRRSARRGARRYRRAAGAA